MQKTKNNWKRIDLTNWSINNRLNAEDIFTPLFVAFSEWRVNMNYRLGVVEAQFADIVWSNEPLPSGRLVALCEEKLEWKKSTTYTVLKKLCEKGLFQNKEGIVSAVLSREDYYGMQGETFVNQAFDGSLPAFIAAFAKRKELTREEIDEIQSMIDSIKEE